MKEDIKMENCNSSDINNRESAEVMNSGDANNTSVSVSGSGTDKSGSDAAFRPYLSKMVAISLLASVVFLPLIFLCTTILASLNDCLLGLLILATGLPVYCYFLYASVIRKTVASHVLRKHSLFSWFNGRKFFATLFSFVMATVMACTVLLVMTSLSSGDIYDIEVLCLGLMTMYATYLLNGSLVSRQYSDWMSWFKSASSCLLLAVPAVFMFCAQALLVYAGIADFELLNGSIAEALAARESVEAETVVASMLINFSEMLDIIFRGVGTFIISRISEDYHWIVKTFLCSLNLSPILILPVTFLIPLSEYKRILIAPTATSTLPEVGFFRVCSGAFKYAVLAAFFMFVLCQVEKSMTPEDRTVMLASVENAVRGVVEKAEKIKSFATSEGVHDSIAFEKADELDRVFNEERAKLEKEYASVMASLKRRMYANVDPFLDNYYTLTAEYLRLFGGTFLEGLENSILQGTETYFARLGNIQHRYREYAEKLGEAKIRLLENTRIADFDPDKYEVIGEISTVDFIKGDYGVIHSAQFRGNSATVTALGAVPLSYRGTNILIGNGVSRLEKLSQFRKELGKKITSRVLSTPVGAAASRVFGKVAAKVLTRVGTGILGGVAAGAAGGSVVPVAGTFLGAVLGGAVAWFATDYIMLRADEQVNRGELRMEIMKAIDKAIDESFM